MHRLFLSMASVLEVRTIPTQKRAYTGPQVLLSILLCAMLGGLAPVPAFGQERGEFSDSLVITAEDVRLAKANGCTIYRNYEAKLGERTTHADSARFMEAVDRLTGQIW